jgi:hypothetical protein
MEGLGMKGLRDSGVKEKRWKVQGGRWTLRRAEPRGLGRSYGGFRDEGVKEKRWKVQGGRWPYYAPNPLRGGAAKGFRD